ncbi:NAD(P)H-binding protein [Leisingera sp. HS039]|uniref:NAD(P)-dependent oxidoreductase n=1 Tax=unclassified Leisingera TaxID=2614906 RepID=UPI0010708A51|nr:MULTISPECIES: NAD(P)H-binding protein [unclassified Leisingera]MBQ4827024.1 NAD(P)H-binding protein [Leisingera sp. HS039]QBR37490.1 potassium transporter TrkA [Leisingera sp. NJS201]
MKIIIFGATGDVGSAAVKAAAQRGHQVTAVSRTPSALAAISPLVTPRPLDLLTDPQAAVNAAAGHDLVISALRPPAGREEDLIPLTRTAVQAARHAGVPALVTGGAALLKLADGSGHTVLSAPGFLPEASRLIAEACAAQDAMLELETGVEWTCLRPPALLTEGPLTGQYQLGTDTMLTDAAGVSQISFADFGAALLDLAENPRPASQRLTVAWGAPAPALAAG